MDEVVNALDSIWEAATRECDGATSIQPIRMNGEFSMYIHT